MKNRGINTQDLLVLRRLVETRKSRIKLYEKIKNQLDYPVGYAVLQWRVRHGDELFIIELTFCGPKSYVAEVKVSDDPEYDPDATDFQDPPRLLATSKSQETCLHALSALLQAKYGQATIGAILGLSSDPDHIFAYGMTKKEVKQLRKVLEVDGRDISFREDKCRQNVKEGLYATVTWDVRHADTLFEIRIDAFEWLRAWGASAAAITGNPKVDAKNHGFAVYVGGTSPVSTLKGLLKMNSSERGKVGAALGITKQEDTNARSKPD